MSAPLTSDQLEQFERAFSSHSGGSLRECECGKRFYSTDSGWDWEEGEFEALEADPSAESHDYTIGTVLFEGREYVVDCTCWHARAAAIVAFLLSHGEQIAEFLSLDKERLQREADRAPVVRG